jgi:CDP-paratose 2-epimerase
MKTLLVTGSSGLIGSQVCAFFHERGWAVHGIDNNQRAIFFGPQGDTRGNQAWLEQTLVRFRHYELDIRDRTGIFQLIKDLRPEAIVHAAAQPSHDRAADIPFDDFDTNAVGTLNLLEAARRSRSESPFVYLSSNKVYGDAPNRIKLRELPTRWDYDDFCYAKGIPEDFPIDQSKHSLFGASKLAADIMVQEYGRYFGMPTCCLRGGCLTGPNHSGVELHGFLNYLIKCNVEEKEYKIFGYKGKQVRDNLHSYDVASFIYEFVEHPCSGEVYNLGGGKGNSCSVLEAFSMIESISRKAQRYIYMEKNRIGDHICYYSDLRKIQAHFPRWKITRTLEDIFEDIYKDYRVKKRLGREAHGKNRAGSRSYVKDI